MPASKRPRYKKRASGFRSTGFRKSVAKIAKTVCRRQAETKTGTLNWNSAIGTNGYFNNVWKNVLQGDAQENRDGDRIHALGVKWRGSLWCDDVYITAKQDSVLYRLIVFSSKRPISTITDAGLSWNSTVDPEKITVLSDNLYHFNLDGRAHMINRYIKFNRKVLYELTSSVTKNELYVCILPANANAGTGMTTTNGLYLASTVQFYFKEM